MSYKLHIKVPHINLTKRHLVVALATVAVVALLLVGVAVAQHHSNVQAAQAVAKHDAAVAAEKQQQAKEQAVTVKLAAVTSQRDQVCQYLAGLAKAKATRSLVTVPVVACTK